MESCFWDCDKCYSTVLCFFPLCLCLCVGFLACVFVFSFGCSCLCLGFFFTSISSWTDHRPVHDKIDLKKPRHQQQQPKEQKQTHRRETHTQTQAQGETPQHSQLAFPPIPETRLQVSGHSRRAVLPMSFSSHSTAKQSAVHCELH